MTHYVSRIKSILHAYMKHITWNGKCLFSLVKHLLWNRSCSEEWIAILLGRTGAEESSEGVVGSLPPPAACTETGFFLHNWEYPIIQLKFLFSWPRSLAPFLHERQNFNTLLICTYIFSKHISSTKSYLSPLCLNVQVVKISYKKTHFILHWWYIILPKYKSQQRTKNEWQQQPHADPGGHLERATTASVQTEVAWLFLHIYVRTVLKPPCSF